VKERPILFSAPMVRALLAGTKTQTRRVVKPQFHVDSVPAEMCATNERGHQVTGHSGRWWDDTTGNDDTAIRCPYGMPGDRLWVRETFMDLGACFLYRADANAEQERAIVAPGQRWQPAIHMPRAASRIDLEVNGVRVERLCEISEADSLAEGVDMEEMIDMAYSPSMPHVTVTMRPRTAREAYAALWESINGPSSWAASPWVWVVEFKRITEAA